MISAWFLLQNNQKKVQFFKKTFLLANTTMKVVLKISFFFFSYLDIDFAAVLKRRFT